MIRLFRLLTCLAMLITLPDLGYAFDQQQQFVSSTSGSANAQVLSGLNVGSLSDLTGVTISFIPSYTNTGAMTFTVNGLTATASKQTGPSGLVPFSGGEIVAGQLAQIMYDGTQFVQQLSSTGKAGLVYRGTDVGTPGTINATMVPSLQAYHLGDVYIITVGSGNAATGAATANLGPGSINITRGDKTPIKAGDYAGGQNLELSYDGTELQIVNFLSSFIPPHNFVQYNTHGSYTFTVPSGIYWIDTTAVGAGGGGATGGLCGNCPSVGGAGYSGGGGGSGATAYSWISVTPGQTVNLVVGAGGTGSNTYAVEANNGGSSSVTTTGYNIVSTGGQGGFLASLNAGGGDGGSASGAQINLSGSIGGDGNINTVGIQGGQGASSSQGGGGRTATIGHPASNVVDGVACGSGGGGIWGFQSSNQLGGTGADGCVYIQY